MKVDREAQTEALLQMAYREVHPLDAARESAERVRAEADARRVVSDATGPLSAPLSQAFDVVDTGDVVRLTGETADAWRDFRRAAADLERYGLALKEAQGAYQRALARLSPLAAKP